MKKSYIYTTCGTSILTTGASGNLLKLTKDYANSQEVDIPGDDLKVLKERVAEVSDTTKGERSCAEIDSLLELVNSESQSDSFAVLLHTDTWLGRKAAEAVEAQAVSRKILKISLTCLESLNTADGAAFQASLGDILSEIIDKWGLKETRDAGYRIVFNLAGGFKSVSGFFTAAGMIFADEVVFKFETAGLLRIPRIPMDFEQAANDSIRGNLAIFRRLNSIGLISSDDVAGLSEVMFYGDGAERTMNTWLKPFLEQALAQEYEGKLLGSWSEKVNLSPKFVEQSNALSSDRLKILNTRVDDLCRYAETGRMLDRLNLKLIKNEDIYQANAWSDGEAKRLDVSKAGDLWTVEELRPHRP